jgi:hypothetical protein
MNQPLKGCSIIGRVVATMTLCATGRDVNSSRTISLHPPHCLPTRGLLGYDSNAVNIVRRNYNDSLKLRSRQGKIFTATFADV